MNKNRKQKEKNKKHNVFMMVRVNHLKQNPGCAMEKNNSTEMVVLKWTKTLYGNNVKAKNVILFGLSQ